MAERAVAVYAPPLNKNQDSKCEGRDELRQFVNDNDIQRLSSVKKRFEDYVEMGWKSVKLIVELVGYKEQSNSDTVVSASCTIVIEKSKEGLIDCIIRGVKDGIAAVRNYLNSHPELLKNLIGPIGKLVAKLTMKGAASLAAKTGAKAIVKVANPGGILADVVQTGFEVGGMPISGRIVGATGNVLAGAAGGTIIGGPIGTVVGGALGFGTWVAGEVVGHFIERELS